MGGVRGNMGSMNYSVRRMPWFAGVAELDMGSAVGDLELKPTPLNGKADMLVSASKSIT